MKKLFWVLFLLAVFASVARAGDQELLDRVVAVVNDEVITQAELDAFLRPIYDQYHKEYSGEEFMKIMNDARQKILSQMIEDKLVYQEAVKQGIEVKEEEVDKELDEFKQRIAKSDDLDLALEKEGMTLKTLRERLRKQAMIRQLHDREIRSKVVVSPSEVEDFFKKNPEKFRIKERVRVRSLTIKKSEASRSRGIPDEKAKERIELLREKIRSGRSFEEIVSRFSEDSHAKQEGLGEWIERGAMIESVDEEIFKTPVGKLTRIVETPIGYHIFRIVEKEPAKEKKFDEMKDQITSYLFQQKNNARFREWMEEIKRASYISIR